VSVLHKAALIVIFLLLNACASNHLVTAPLTPPAPVKLAQQPRVVLVLGAGGVRGYAHLGVLQALEEAQIPVDVLVGASAGSVVASIYADNESFQKTYDILMPAGFWDYADMGNLGGSGGVIEGYQLQSFMMSHMGARDFSELKKKVIVATTDIHSGQLYSIESGPIAPAVLASSAVPGAVKPVNLYGHTLIDGGVTSPVPVELAKRLHPKLIIAVDVSAKTNTASSSAIGVLDSAVYIMGQRLTQMSLNGADIVISPEVGDANLFDIRKKHDMYLAGLHATRQEIPKIRMLLAMASK
jgi:NTE family protein